MPFNLGFGEIVLILFVLLLFFGPKRMPEMGESLGRGIREFRRALSGNDEGERDLAAPVLSPPEHTVQRSEAPHPAEPESRGS